MRLPAVSSARGRLRGAFSISSSMKDAHSQPEKAKKMVDQKMAFWRVRCGVMEATVKWVAEPWCEATTMASAMRMEMGSQPPTEQTLLSHLPDSIPRTLRAMMTKSQKTAKAM